MRWSKYYEGLKALSIHERRNTLRSMDRQFLRDFLYSVNDAQIKDLTKDLPSDELTDIFEAIDRTRHSAILGLLDTKKASKVVQLLLYGKDTAGGIMATEYISFNKELTVDDVVQKIRSTPPEENRVYYLYVVDSDGRLEGVISIRDLVIKSSHTRVKDIMHKAVITIPHKMDKESVTKIFDKHSFLALPVIDETNRIIGVITADAVSRVAREEATGDLIKLSGMDSEELSMDTPVGTAVKKRLPWLVLNMLLDVIAVSVVAFYQGTLEAVIAIAVLMPIISDMGGNAGFQGLSLIIRDFALGKISPGSFFRVLKKQTLMGLIIGGVLGLEFALLAYFWKWNPYLGLVAGTAMFLNVYAAGLIGALLPIVLKKLNIDPVVATAPILTTITDLTGFSIILFLASKTVHLIK